MPGSRRRRRCTGRTAAGRRCKGWAATDSEPPRCSVHMERERRCGARTAKGEPCAIKPLAGRNVCHIHAGRVLPRKGDVRRCSAVADGRRCKGWAVRGSKPALCWSHVRRQGPSERRRCEAMTVKEERCRNWAMEAGVMDDGGRRLCVVHAGLTPMPGDEDYGLDADGGKRGCSALTAVGERCGHWALLNSEPPLCYIHAHGARYRPPEAADRARGRQCTARTLDGKRCERWALLQPETGHGGERPLCWMHASPHNSGRISHSYYRRVPYFGEETQAKIAALAGDEERPLAAELALVRLKLRGVLQYLGRRDLTAQERLRATAILLRGVRAVAHLLKARKELVKVKWTPESAGGLGYLLERIVEG